MSDMSSQRIAVLHHSWSHALHRVPCLLVPTAALALFSGQAKPQEQPGTPQRIVEANEFRLVDNAGNARARLTTHNGEPSLVLLGKSGDARAIFALKGELATVTFTDSQGHMRLCAGGGDAGSLLWFLDANGQPKLRLDCSPNMFDGAPSIGLFGSDPDLPNVLFKADPKAGIISLYDSQYRRASLSCAHGAASMLTLNDTNGKLAVAASTQDAGCGVSIHDSREKPRAWLKLDDGRSELGVADAQGRTQALPGR